MYIKFWKNQEDYQIYDISKSKEKQKLDNIINVHGHICLDDTVKLFTQKISIYMSKYLKVNENQIYLWYEQKIKSEDKHSIFINFINNVFKNDTYIDSSYFTECIQNYFLLDPKINTKQIIDKNTALETLHKLNITYIIVPIIFKYINNGFFEYINYDELIKG
jgi:hypothetical protein